MLYFYYKSRSNVYSNKTKSLYLNKFYGTHQIIRNASHIEYDAMHLQMYLIKEFTGFYSCWHKMRICTHPYCSMDGISPYSFIFQSTYRKTLFTVFNNVLPSRYLKNLKFEFKRLLIRVFYGCSTSTYSF